MTGLSVKTAQAEGFYLVQDNGVKRIGRYTFKPGDFAIYFPGERHAPNLAVTGPAMHKKAVFKIRADLAEL